MFTRGSSIDSPARRLSRRPGRSSVHPVLARLACLEIGPRPHYPAGGAAHAVNASMNQNEARSAALGTALRSRSVSLFPADCREQVWLGSWC